MHVKELYIDVCIRGEVEWSELWRILQLMILLYLTDVTKLIKKIIEMKKNLAVIIRLLLLFN